MLLTRILTKVNDLDQYIELYYSKIGVRISLQYLKNSHVRVFYYAQAPQRWVAGYVQNGDGSLRYFQNFDIHKRIQLLNQIGEAATDILETGCMFSDCKTPSKRHQVYLTLLWDAYRANKKAYLGGSIIPKIQEFQMKTMPHVLVHETMVFDGKEMKMKQYFAPKGEFFMLSRRLFVSEIKTIFRKIIESYFEKWTGGKSVIKPFSH